MDGEAEPVLPDTGCGHVHQLQYLALRCQVDASFSLRSFGFFVSSCGACRDRDAFALVLFFLGRAGV